MNSEHSRLSDRTISRRSLGGMLVAGTTGVLAVPAGAISPAKTPPIHLSARTAEDHLAIEELVYRYAMALDSLDLSGMKDLFTLDSPQYQSLEAAIEYHRKYEHTIHHVQNHVHTVNGNAATGFTYCVASMVKRDEMGLTKFDVYLRYRDKLAKQDHCWYFSKRDADILFSSKVMTVEPGAPMLREWKIDPGSLRTPPLLGPRP